MQRTTKDKPELSHKAEKLLEDIDTGKVKMTRYTADEYLKKVKKLIKED
ncbi:MAG: hypothetical protein KGI33_09115 [Thaumarchaeota archaeon]|nr:hypothetical protein [Nitrososphaerota archaeon]